MTQGGGEAAQEIRSAGVENSAHPGILYIWHMPDMPGGVNMPRPQRKRTIYQLPECRTFTAEHAAETVVVTLDELSARLSR